MEARIAEVQRGMADAELAWMFGNCLPNTLDTTAWAGTMFSELILELHAERPEVLRAGV